MKTNLYQEVEVKGEKPSKKPNGTAALVRSFHIYAVCFYCGISFGYEVS